MPPPPSITLASAGAGGMVEKTPEPPDMLGLVAAVSSEAAEWVEDVKAAVASCVTGERRAEFEAAVAGLEAAASLFQDTPDDLHELL